ncbi:MAG: hypothetical protein RLZZ450_272 [Pseudomonadota bacterium]
MTVSEDLSFFDSADEAGARPEEGSSPHKSSAQYLVFVVSGMEMAVALAAVSEILPYERVSELPGTPPFVRGVAHVRGRVIPVVDLAVKLGRKSEPTTKRSCILMLELSLHGAHATASDALLTVGIVMDGVATLLDLERSQIRDAPRFGNHIETRYVDGLVPTESGMLPIIDCELHECARHAAADHDAVLPRASRQRQRRRACGAWQSKVAAGPRPWRSGARRERSRAGRFFRALCGVSTMAQSLVPLHQSSAQGDPRAASGTSQYLTFTVDRELFAIPIAKVREVVEFQGMTRIPLSPAVVPGVLNLRGAVVPVIDLAVRFGRRPTEVGRRTCVVIVEMRSEESVQLVGVLVDSVSEALEVSADRLEHRPLFGAGLRAEFVAGMLNLEGRFVVVLEPSSVLSMSELERLVSGRDAEGTPSQALRLASSAGP